MHKDREANSTPPFRPIVSSIGTYNYNLAKYLCHLLTPHIPADYCATDTFTITQKKRSAILLSAIALDIKLLFSSFKIGNLFGVKDPVPDGLRSRVVYKFVCAGCNACYVGETSAGIFPHVLESTKSVTGPLTFSGI